MNNITLTPVPTRIKAGEVRQTHYLTTVEELEQWLNGHQLALDFTGLGE